MKTQEVFNYINKTAVRCNVTKYKCCGVKDRIVSLKIGESVILVFEHNKVNAYTSVCYCGDPKQFDTKKIVKITKEGIDVYNMKVTRADQIQVGEIYR